jgi:hypothetical protein
MRWGWLLGAVAFAPYVAWAEDLPTDKLRGCTQVKDSLQRLQCFDQAMEVVSKADTPTPKEPAVGWQVDDESDKLDGSRRVTALVLATDNDDARRVSTLYIRCLKGKTEAFISWPKYLGSTNAVAVGWRADDAPIKAEHWSPSTDGRAAFQPSPIPFVNRSLARRSWS